MAGIAIRIPLHSVCCSMCCSMTAHCNNGRYCYQDTSASLWSSRYVRNALQCVLQYVLQYVLQRVLRCVLQFANGIPFHHCRGHGTHNCVAVCVAVCVAACVAACVAVSVTVCVAVSGAACVAVCIVACVAVCVAVCAAVCNRDTFPSLWSLLYVKNVLQCVL